MGAPISLHRRRPRWPAVVAVMVLAAVAAAAPLPAGPQVGLGTGQEPSADQAPPTGLAPITPVAVTDPLPAPGAVVEPGPHVVAAAIEGADPTQVQFLLDGARTGRFTDPDGQLSGRRGAEVTLTPGPHTLAVALPDRGIVREWSVIASGLTVDVAGQDPAEVAVRAAGRRPGTRPVVLVDPARPDLAIPGVPLATALDALLLPVTADGLPPATRQALADLGDPAEQEVLAVGGPDGVSQLVLDALADVGYPVTRLGEGTPAEVAAAVVARQRADVPDAAIVVAPAEPLETARQAATTAASLDAGLVLVGAAGPPVAALDVLAEARTVLLATALSDLQRLRVVEALPADAAISDDTLQPRRAAEVIVLLDGVDDGVAVLAGRAADPNRAVVRGTSAGRDHIATHRPDRVTLVGDPSQAAAAEPLLHQAWVDGPDAPAVEALVDPAQGPTVTLTASAPLEGAEVHVDLLGFEWPGAAVVSGNQVTWTGQGRPRLPASLEPAAEGTDARIDVTAVLRTATGVRHLRATSTALIAPLPSISAEGFQVAGGSSEVVGTGPLRTFSVEVEPLTALDVEAVADEVTEILLDPRSWTADGAVSLQRVGSSVTADLRVVVARPATVDRLCGAVGLSTGGRVSCWDGYRAMLNLDRWNTGVVPFHADIEVYRQYLVNHEFGHGLGHGHVFCPAPGALAPVMMQQTGGLGFCRANGWPFPDAGQTPAAE